MGIDVPQAKEEMLGGLGVEGGVMGYWMNYWCVDNCWPVVWLMYSVGYNWSMSMLDGSMAGNIGSGNSQEGRDCNKSLHKIWKIAKSL